MKRLSEKEIKEYLFKILQVFDGYCREKKIMYSLAYGTLIGAIRHRDFIPWDDDIDVYMTRPNYEIFLKEYDGKRNHRYQLITLENGLSDYPYAKLVDKYTTVKEKYNNADQHLWIDIFPVDGVPLDYDKCFRNFKKIQKLRKSQGRCTAIIGEGTTWVRKVGKIPLMIVPKLRGSHYYGKEIDKIAKQICFENSKTVAQIVSSSKLCLYERKMFEKYIEVEFHGKNFFQ